MGVGWRGEPGRTPNARSVASVGWACVLSKPTGNPRLWGLTDAQLGLVNLSKESQTLGGATSSGRLVRRLLIRFEEADFAELEALASRSSLSRGSMVRHLIELGRQAMAGPDESETRLLVLAALVAAEHTRLYVEAMLPPGRVRSAGLGEAALDAAQERLAALELEAHKP